LVLVKSLKRKLYCEQNYGKVFVQPTISTYFLKRRQKFVFRHFPKNFDNREKEAGFRPSKAAFRIFETPFRKFETPLLFKKV
jgi:hypothetical protein